MMTIYDFGWMIADCRRAQPKYDLAACANHPSSFLPHPSSRRGISLLEVLISMFVLLVGLLGVASLIPVGRFEVERGARIERASACGRAAMREMKVRGMLNPNSWATLSNQPVFYPATNEFSLDDGTTPLTVMPAFAIDPLAMTVADNGLRSFPYDSSGSAPLVPTPPVMPRITLGPGMTLANRLALAETVFRWQDDLAFEIPSGATALPKQVLQGGTKRLSQGDYSWLATVAPDANMTVGSNLFDIPMRVSVAVFHKRPLNVPGAGERICNVELIANGEITLSVNDPKFTPPQPVDPQYASAGSGPAHLEVKPGQWLMIAGPVDPTNTSGPWDYRWYRVVNADAVTDQSNAVVTSTNPGTGPWKRNVTIAGADWAVPLAQLSTFNNHARAFLFDGIVAVYEQKMKLERDSIYGN